MPALTSTPFSQTPNLEGSTDADRADGPAVGEHAGDSQQGTPGRPPAVLPKFSLFAAPASQPRQPLSFRLFAHTKAQSSGAGGGGDNGGAASGQELPEATNPLNPTSIKTKIPLWKRPDLLGLSKVKASPQSGTIGCDGGGNADVQVLVPLFWPYLAILHLNRQF